MDLWEGFKMFNTNLFLIIKFPFLVIRTSNKMQKVSPFSNNKNLLPCIYGEPSNRNFRSISHKNHKENIHTENSCTEKASHHASTNRFAKKMSTQNMAPKLH